MTRELQEIELMKSVTGLRSFDFIFEVLTVLCRKPEVTLF